MYLNKTSKAPVHYIMKGYNTLTGSHFDKYELYYFDYVVGNVTDDDFEVKSSLKCRGFPSEPGVEAMVHVNPMLEFINNEDRHVHESFEDFKAKHGKTYSDEAEHEGRKTSTDKTIGLSYAVKLNHLADLYDHEIHTIRGLLPFSGLQRRKAFPQEEFPKSIPDAMDWRLFGAVTPVKDQAMCGSCWSFGTTGAVEGAYGLSSGAMKTNKLVRLSQQQLIDCSWNHLNNGCEGGLTFTSYEYIMATGGLATEEDYGSYLGEDGICHERKVPKTAVVKAYVNVTSGDVHALKQAIAKKGPVAVSIDASDKGFSFYSHGVYYNPDCKNGIDQLDHAVLAVGYGVMNGEPYWIVKNSWSTNWGNDGYVLMSQKNNNCGVATDASYVEM
ncbi:counting factor associated protein D [Caerostris extrusa]|uniref:Counting factor associated protein D n=1 Tax=Caerostris extrusa TaxID=172846 RepID=A0AAV4Y7A1_CAEEX|nr:counting factor associated protein D [Caerostris extrusa]